MQNPAIAQIYVNLITGGDMEIYQVPPYIREDVEALWYEQQAEETSSSD